MQENLVKYVRSSLKLKLGPGTVTSLSLNVLAVSAPPIQNNCHWRLKLEHNIFKNMFKITFNNSNIKHSEFFSITDWIFEALK